MTMKKLKRIFLLGLVILLAFLLTIVCINLSVVGTASPKILNDEQISVLDADCILVLGCGLRVTLCAKRFRKLCGAFVLGYLSLC